MSLPTLTLAAASLCAGFALLAWKHTQTVHLRHEVHALQDEAKILPLLEEEKNRLVRLQVGPAELEQLRREHTEIERLRVSLLLLGNQVIAEELFRRAISDTHSPKPAAEHAVGPEPFARYEGNDTPKAVLQSVIWAANSGNVDALAPLITFEPTGRAKAEQLFQGLPAAVQAEYGAPEKVYATLIAANIPLGLTEARPLRESPSERDRVTVTTRLQRGGADGHDAQFIFQRKGAVWQLVVPDRIVEKFGSVVTGKSPPKTS